MFVRSSSLALGKMPDEGSVGGVLAADGVSAQLIFFVSAGNQLFGALSPSAVSFSKRLPPIDVRRNGPDPRSEVFPANSASDMVSASLTSV